MARPKTKGSTIGVQLPLTVDRAVRDTARTQRCSPGEWIGRLVINQLAEVRAATDPRSNPPNRPHPETL